MVMTNVRCSVCRKAWGTCDCWTHCSCGWYFRKGRQCNNPEHYKPPRDVECPYCHAKIGEACVQRNGIRQSWAHAKRQKVSEMEVTK